MGSNARGFLLSTDALVAIGMLLMLAVFLSGLSLTYHSPELMYQRLYYAARDLLTVLQEMRIADIQEFSTIRYYIERGTITQDDLNKSFFDLIGSLWAAGNLTDVKNLTQDVVGSILQGSKYGYEVFIGNTSIYLRNETAPNYIARLSVVVSGYDVGRPVSGFVANAYLERLSKTTSRFVYFGGYVGDGNITQIVKLPEDANVSKAEMELDAGGDFYLYINDNLVGAFSPSQENMTADNWTICDSPANCFYFTPGENTIRLNFTGNRNYIGGGYLKIDYNTSKPDTLPLSMSNDTAVKRDMFPGIEGIINLYSSFYIPGELRFISAHLHYLSNYTVFMAIGNVTVFEHNATGEQSINLTNESIGGNLSAGGLGFRLLSNRTVPLRIGLKNISYVLMGSGKGDSVLVTDVSGSMGWCAVYDVPYMCNYNCLLGGTKRCEVGSPDDCRGNVCGGFCFIPYNHHLDCNQTKLDVAKNADKEFVDIVLNESVPGNRAGLVSYADSVESFQDITDNKTTLYSEIDSYVAGGATCICCGINRAVDMLVTQSNSSRRRTIVVMSDGEANVGCEQQGTGDAKQDTIQAACDAYNNYNITVYTVGYGPDADNETLNQTALCGGGQFYFSNVTELAETFREIAENILNASYAAQTVEVQGNISMDTVLYPDSYIEFEYIPTQIIGYGEVSLTFETERFGGNVTSPKNGSFYIPAGVKVADAKVTSYSSQYWTDRLFFNSSLTNGWNNVFDLSMYGSEYTNLGDPYIIYIPLNLVSVGGNNYISIDTAANPSNTTGGSPDNRVIYSLVIDGSVGYGDVFFSEQNATDDAIQRLENKLAQYNITLMEGRADTQSVSGVTSMWGPSRIEARCWT